MNDLILIGEHSPVDEEVECGEIVEKLERAQVVGVKPLKT